MKKKLEDASDQIVQETGKSIEKEPEREGDLTRVVSTGSTLLDLAISGGVLPEGGIPGGILVEIWGGESLGKTALLCGICQSAQSQGGRGCFKDPEGRINENYARIYGVDFHSTGWDIEGPEKIGTVEDFFEGLEKWDPGPPGNFLDVVAADSLAALASREELSGEAAEMAAARRAAKFSEGLRITKATLAKKSRLLVCSNQTRAVIKSGGFGPKEKATGGHAIAFWASLRIRLTPAFPGSKIEMSRSIRKGLTIKRPIGIRTDCEIVKSSIDDPYREAQICIVFNYGIDDIRANIEYLKEIKGTTSYEFCGQSWGTIDKAISVVEEEGLERKLKEEVIHVWREIEEKFKSDRKPKGR